MATATSLPPTDSHSNDANSAERSGTDLKQPPASSFVKFDDKQATVFVNTRHIVRFEFHPMTGRAHLQLSDGHHYYLSDKMAKHVIDQLEKCQ